MNLLFLDCCVRGKEVSRTFALCESFLAELKRNHEELSVKTLSLYLEDLKPVGLEMLEKRDKLEKQQCFEDPMFDYARELAAADYILVGAPYWDYSFPACLKIYIEQTSVGGIAFKYTESGSVGLCSAKKMLYVSTAGGPMPEIHTGEEYMRQICKFYGVGGFETYCLEQLDIDGMDVDGMMTAAKSDMKKLAADFI